MPIRESQNYHQKNATMAFYNEKEQVCLETERLCFGLGESLLQMRGNMWLKLPTMQLCN